MPSGGTRKGAGRKPSPDSRTKRFIVYLTPEAAERVKDAGGSKWAAEVLEREAKK